MVSYHPVSNASVAGRCLLVRVDLNVPMHDDHITDTARIDRLVPGLQDLIAKGAKIVLLSHFGRPKGKIVKAMSLAPIAPALAKALGQDVAFIPTWRGPETRAAIQAMGPGGCGADRKFAI